MALTQGQRIGIIEARTLAAAYTREALIDALSLCNSPSVAGLSQAELAGIRMDQLQAAAFGALSAMAEELCNTVEDLADRVDRYDRQADILANVIAGTGNRPRPSAHTHDRCATCNRDAHYPGSAGNHGHPYKAPAGS